MATVWIPSLARPLTEGAQVVEASGTTVLEVMEDLEGRFPGLRDRLFSKGRLHPGIAMAVDGVVENRVATVPIGEDSEIHFLPAMSGG